MYRCHPQTLEVVKAVRRGAFVRDGVIVWVEKEGGVTEPVMPVSEVHLKGAHNIENVLAAVCVARLDQCVMFG